MSLDTANQDLLTAILRAQSVSAHFQPQVAARSQDVMGLEALCRGIDPRDGRLIPPKELFDLAASDEALIALDRLCRRKALETFREINGPDGGLLLSLNFEAGLLDKGVCGSGHIINLVRELGLDPRRIIIEIVESKVRDLAALERFAAAYKDYGFLLALDDLGAGHSNLERVGVIKPDVIKIDRSLISGLDQHYHHQEITRALLGLSHKIGALVVAEGVETEAEALAALELGVDVMQGYYFARPAPGVESLALCQRRMRQVAANFRSYALEKIAAKQTKRGVFEAVAEGIAHELARLAAPELDRHLAGLLSEHPYLECLYVLDAEGVQVSGTVCDPDKLDTKRRAIFWPAPKGADQSLKRYYLLLKAGLERYVSEPYISLASGKLCLTVSCWFIDRDRQRRILCADFTSEPAAPAEPGLAALAVPA
jgi:EAL domain-containing protein (putative c-di-GMP-specific phosphodiesterase class I)